MNISLSTSLDRKVFVLKSSTASEVNHENPTEFRYFEDQGVIWGDFSGDTVLLGRMVGKRLQDTVELSFVFHTTANEIISGSALTRIMVAADGSYRLEEDFTGPDGRQHHSCCVEKRSSVAPH